MRRSRLSVSAHDEPAQPPVITSVQACTSQQEARGVSQGAAAASAGTGAMLLDWLMPMPGTHRVVPRPRQMIYLTGQLVAAGLLAALVIVLVG